MNRGLLGRAVAGMAAIALIAAGARLVWTSAPGELRLRADDARVVAQGREIYAAQCAACHGADLAGQPDWKRPLPDGRLPAPPHDENGHTWHHDSQLLFDLTKFGIGAMIDDPDYLTDMPVYDGLLSDDQIVAVLSYIKSTWPAGIRARHDRLDRE
ncbi:Cytochrome c, mono-and diheme variants [Paracoccus halophilus]|uniref:Cytochrome C n=1 Tax=Paracoccus halophilus TaxID=376733 RepID=A0A099EZF1_9RHOB|nr:cytochrome c [Paracoccus halophilus]KGJ03361.1 cytochrome C [Paracoccus halophilus]SFA58862.1 Cytochrome c, mono-and diheme variants [Paracoccus halophilus]